MTEADIKIPQGGFQLDGKGPAIFAVGDDAEVFMAFEKWPKEEFHRTLMAFLSTHFSLEDYQDDENKIEPSAIEWEHASVSFGDTEDDWEVKWGISPDNGPLTVTVWQV